MLEEDEITTKSVGPRMREFGMMCDSCRRVSYRGKIRKVKYVVTGAIIKLTICLGDGAAKSMLGVPVCYFVISIAISSSVG